ncbi:MAG: shikimate dehydrogenase [Alphaproteobacteria bacterium]|nr:shikimate dehydrogenase [Alphaproteobacteria bacterium]
MKAAVVGNPVDHSLSPDIHNFWLNEAGLKGVYTKKTVRDENLTDFITSAAKEGFSGLNITVPHKEKALKACDVLSATAKELGAVNLITFKNGIIFGDNTDGQGFIESIKEKLPNISFEKNSFAILGAGGAAKGIIHALHKNSAKKITIINRNYKKAKDLANKYKETAVPFDLKDIKKGLNGASFLINTTTMGMRGGPASINIDFLSFPEILCFTDIVYNPKTTNLMKSATKSGVKVIGGIGMLVNQAVPAFQAFYGEEPRNLDKLYSVLENKMKVIDND